jgi:hypothetical protein
MLDALNTASGVIHFHSGYLEMLMGAWDTRYKHFTGLRFRAPWFHEEVEDDTTGWVWGRFTTQTHSTSCTGLRTDRGVHDNARFILNARFLSGAWVSGVQSALRQRETAQWLGIQWTSAPHDFNWRSMREGADVHMQNHSCRVPSLLRHNESPWNVE